MPAEIVSSPTDVVRGSPPVTTVASPPAKRLRTPAAGAASLQRTAAAKKAPAMDVQGSSSAGTRPVASSRVHGNSPAKQPLPTTKVFPAEAYSTAQGSRQQSVHTQPPVVPCTCAAAPGFFKQLGTIQEKKLLTRNEGDAIRKLAYRSDPRVLSAYRNRHPPS